MITTYRGFTIVKEGETDFAIRYRSGNLVTRCGTAWSCICYIDELLSA